MLRLLSLRQTLIQRLTNALDAWHLKPHHASLFGSAARADGNTNSDVDVFIVRPADVDSEMQIWSGQVNELQERILRWTGNHAGIVEVSMGELEGLQRERPPVVAELERDAISLAGPPVHDIFRVGAT